MPRNETPQQRDKRLELLNEYLSDEFLEELATMLTRQYVEKDAFLKFIMRKYLDLGVIEATSIKDHFRVDVESLMEMKA